MPELSGQVTDTDWYAFDVAAATRWWQIRTPKDHPKDGKGKGMKGTGTGRGERMPAASGHSGHHRPPHQPGQVRYEPPDPTLPLELGGVLHGTEVPPWER